MDLVGIINIINIHYINDIYKKTIIIRIDLIFLLSTLLICALILIIIFLLYFYLKLN